jgi:hypothetical protein
MIPPTKPKKKSAAKASAAKKHATTATNAKRKKTEAIAKRGRRTAKLGGASVAELRVKEIEALREEVERTSKGLLPRWNADPEDVQKSVAQLVLALVEFLRKLLERQAIRRMEAESLRPEEVERIGLALMRLEETVHDLAARFGLAPEDLNLDLGPLGRLT